MEANSLSDITMHGIANCDTIKKAKKWLTEAGIAYDFRDYKKQPPGVSEIENWTKLVAWEQLVNKRGTTWRKLDPALQNSVNADSAPQLLADNPSMIKRPLVIKGDQAILGFTITSYEQFFA